MNEPNNQNSTWFERLKQRPTSALALILGIWGVALLTMWAMYGSLEERFETGVFFGRLHILVLHMPIGLVGGVFALEILALAPSCRDFSKASLPMLWLGLLGGICATMAGYLLMQSDQYTGKFMTLHLWTGLSVVLLTALTLLLKLKENQNSLYLASLAATFILITVSSHYGGNMVHGESYLTEFAPEPIAKLLGEGGEEEPGSSSVALDDRLLYDDVIQPIFDAKCTECHYDGKIKGELRMDSFEWLAKGGDTGPAFVAGDTEASEVFYRVTVEQDDDDFMPPEDKGEPMTQDEVALLALWIEKGASPDMTIGQAEPDEGTREILEAFFAKGDSEDTGH